MKNTKLLDKMLQDQSVLNKQVDGTIVIKVKGRTVNVFVSMIFYLLSVCVYVCFHWKAVANFYFFLCRICIDSQARRICPARRACTLSARRPTRTASSEPHSHRT
jgi:hypothetical protein